MRYLGLDFGDKTIGVSISNINNRVATGVTTIIRTGEEAFRPALKELKKIIAEYGITNIILGNPINMDGSESERSHITLVFKGKLERYFKNIHVELWDERLSTRAVARVFEGNRKKYNKSVDEMAAVYILQGFLDNTNLERSKKMTNDNDDIVLYNDDGDEMPLQILASREDPTGVYVLALEGEEDVAHFKLIPGDEDEMIFELIDDEHEDFEYVFNLFKDDYESLGIDVDFEM